jgi:hypothetical protein
VFVDRMRAVTADAQSIENRNPQRSKKVSIRRATDLRFAEFEPEMRGNTARLFEQFHNRSSAFERGPIDASGHKHFRSIVNGLQTRKDPFNFA